MKPIKVVWICGFSNSDIRARVVKKINPLEPQLTRLVHRRFDSGSDAGVWITNGIKEMKQRNDVELHVVTPVRDLSSKLQEFCIDNVHYHFVRDENSGLRRKVIRYLFTRNTSQFKKNRKRIRAVVDTIGPDLVHVIGAENPHYSLALLDMPESIPTLLQLQALLVSLQDKVTGDLAKNFTYKGEIETRLIQRADYIGTCAQAFIRYIRENIKPDARIVNTTLAMAQRINLSDTDKEFTFVHYASGLSSTKATDVALEAFSIARKSHPKITLDVIGGCNDDFKEYLDKLIEEHGLEDAVVFEGRLPTHDDVIRQIRKARFALLPIKTDIVPNTLHEAMANGLPLLTTATEDGTTRLNERRDSVLLSPIGDFNDLARNMCYLLDHPDKAEELRQNAAQTEVEHANNRDIIEHWVEVYKAVLATANEGASFPEEFLL